MAKKARTFFSTGLSLLLKDATTKVGMAPLRSQTTRRFIQTHSKKERKRMGCGGLADGDRAHRARHAMYNRERSGSVVCSCERFRKGLVCDTSICEGRQIPARWAPLRPKRALTSVLSFFFREEASVPLPLLDPLERAGPRVAAAAGIRRSLLRFPPSLTAHHVAPRSAAAPQS